MNLNKYPLMALGLCTALGAVACGSEDSNGNGTTTVFDMGGNGNGNGNGNATGEIDMGDNGGGNSNGNAMVDMGNDMVDMGDPDSGMDPDLGPDELLDFAVAPEMETLEVGETQQLTITGTFRRAGEVTLTADDGVNFGLDMAGVIEVDPDGLVTAVAEGMAQVIVTLDDSALTATANFTVVQDPCPRGTEGCRCSASTNAGSTNLAQDDCDAGLTCLPLTAWYDEFRIPNEPPFPITQTADTCVQTCVEDADCGMGRFCSVNAFNASNLGGAVGVCADQVASFEEACSLSLEEDSLVEIDTDGDQRADTPIEQFAPGVLQGCDTGLTCFHHFFIGSVSANMGLGTNPNEAVCLPLCTEDADCAGFATRPECSFVFNDQLGICNDRQVSLGDLARQPSTVAGPNAIVETFQNSCSDPTVQLAVGGVPVCFELCDGVDSCTLTTGGGDAARCVQPNPNVGGVCTSDCLERDEPVNDTVCPADRSCLGGLELNFQDDPNGPEILGEIAVCRASFEPSWDPVEVGSMGQVDVMTGDDCFPNMTQADIWTCAPKSNCFDVGGAGNQIPRCVTPCDFVANSTTSQAYCEAANGAGSVCTDQEQLAEGFGFCSTP